MTDQNSLSALGITPEHLQNAMDKDFGEMLNETFADRRTMQGQVVKGLVTAIDDECASIDIGMKAEGRIYLSEFADLDTGEVTLKVGDEVEVYIENLDDRRNRSQLSREKARREAAMVDLEKACEAGEKVQGTIFSRVKGGFAVDVAGVLAFLPGSQLDARPVKDTDYLLNTSMEFQIVKIDRKSGNLIVSRRAIMDESRAEMRDELLKDMHEGKVVTGVIKNITDYGAFVDLGGIDGLLHITDIAWHRISHPSEVISLGQTMDMKVTRYDEANKRVSLGLKQMSDDPWTTVEQQYPLKSRVKGTITNITDYGAFVELAPGVEGLIHVSEMSWTRKNVHPGKLVSTSQEVEVEVLEIDHNKRRISLGLKQCQENPWTAYAAAHKEGDEVEGQVRSITDFGVFIGLTDDIDGLVHVSDLSWEKSGEEAIRSYKKGDSVKAKILALDPEKERVALGVKQLSEDPLAGALDGISKGATVKAIVTATSDEGVTVKLADNEEMTTVIAARDLSRDKSKQTPSSFKEGDKVTAKVVSINTRDRKLTLSIRAAEIAEEKEAVAAYAKSNDEGDSAMANALAEAMANAKK